MALFLWHYIYLAIINQIYLLLTLNQTFLYSLLDELEIATICYCPIFIFSLPSAKKKDEREKRDKLEI